eukprot:scaffold114069_cov36-Prasinocladus_malaysianus.AAC.1
MSSFATCCRAQNLNICKCQQQPAMETVSHPLEVSPDRPSNATHGVAWSQPEVKSNRPRNRREGTTRSTKHSATVSSANIISPGEARKPAPVMGIQAIL